MDVSQRVIFEDNELTLADSGTIPHGTAVSGYDKVSGRPMCRRWFIARNRFSRPPCRGPLGSGGQCGCTKWNLNTCHGDNWDERESLTTDGPGGYAVGFASQVSGKELVVNWTAWRRSPLLGAAVMVIAGPGVGQSRRIRATPTNGTLLLDQAFDAHLTVGSSLLAVVVDYSEKLIVGNTFSWSSVVQSFGQTVRHVFAFNQIKNGNFRHGPHGTGGIMGVTGIFYRGAMGVGFFTEFLDNQLYASDGIGLLDKSSTTPEKDLPRYGGFGGPWLRWLALRGNSLSGISLAAINATAPGEKPACAGIMLTNTGSHAVPSRKSTDIVAEHQRFSCPPEGKPVGVDFGHSCEHCVGDDNLLNLKLPVKPTKVV